MPKNLVVCLDGTSNEPESGKTNVARVFEIASKGATQMAYYDPGVGTMGSRAALTKLGKAATRVTGLALGHGIKENIEEAYRFLMHNYEPGDQVYVFGFSRGAYTARALTGMLRTVGLLRPGADNLVSYALKLYAQSGKKKGSAEDNAEFWAQRTDFNDTFGNPAFPGRFEPQVHFLGVWDTVKSVGWLNWRAKFQQAKWPFTRNVANVTHGRHAMAIDEKRRFYEAYRFSEKAVADPDRDLREVWFSGIHSDVGGTYEDDHRLADLALQWMVDEAAAKGMEIDDAAYKKHVGVAPGKRIPLDPDVVVHENGKGWMLLGLGWSRRTVEAGDDVHPSVHELIDVFGGSYRPKLP